jgi:asparagine synthase (glutamine-hydrolysing)
MCGIVGFVSVRRFAQLVVKLPEAVSRLAHRGPDDFGTYTDDKNGVGLGHRRLSILDLSAAGRQPMGGGEGDCARIVYNGEVYNFTAIRSELEALGETFHTGTDTEVVLKAYLRFGIACLERFVGMFAFAIWDERERRLFLARDRLGIKPLYYYLAPDALVFGSELKALKAFPGVADTLDTSAAARFFHYQYVPAPHAIFRDTWKLLPGEYLVYDGQRLEKGRYWSLPVGAMSSEGTSDHSENEILDELEAIVFSAVKARLVSDVPLGALLSGGIDSSLVVAAMQHTSASPVHTFSIGFREQAYDEAPWARKVAEHLGTKHTELYVSVKDALNVVPRLPELYDEPFADTSGIPTYLVSSLARDHVKVALSGDGGDELFGGYAHYWATLSKLRSVEWLPSGLRLSGAYGAKKLLQPSLITAAHAAMTLLPENLRSRRPAHLLRVIQALLKGDLAELHRLAVTLWSQEEVSELTGLSPARGRFEETFENTAMLPALSRLMHVDTMTSLPDQMLTKVDRASMAVALEVRVPLLDHRLAAFAVSIPEDLKLRGHGKYLLKRLLARFVPEELIDRPKQGFGIPLKEWLSGELKELLLDHLSPIRLEREGFLNPQCVAKTLQEHFSGQADHRFRLWSLLMWEMWRERWL